MKSLNIDSKFLNRQRQVGDHEADVLISGIFKKNQQAEFYKLFTLPEKEILKLESIHPGKKFLLTPKSLPTWYDEKRILRGQAVFENYAIPIMTLLGVMSLPYCYAASPGNKALYLTEKMRKSPGKRLAETGEFTISVLRKGNLQPGEIGLIQINKTRLIHAMARYYLQKGSWDTSWGVPINQEDMAGTNMAFSYVILLGLQISGHVLSDREKEDFLYVWKFIGYQLGINETLLPNDFQQARLLSETIKKRTLRKTEEGITLTKELIAYYKSVLPPQQANFVSTQMRYYLGSEVAEYLGLPVDAIKDKLAGFTNAYKELQNLFSLPKNQMGELLANYQVMKAKSNLSK
ncbi:oxygenase MpaB family protein [soil metagenome]